MSYRKKSFLLPLINAVFMGALVLLHYNGAFTFKLWQATPMLPLTLLVAIGMFSTELTAALTGLAVGIFMDSAASTPQGFHAIIFLCLGLGISLIVKHLFNNNVFSSCALCLMASALYFILRWCFCFAFSLTFTQSLNYLLQIALPSVIYTSVFIIPFYYLERYLFSKIR